MLKLLLVGLATLVLVAGGAAFYLLYALKPPPSSRTAETVVLTVQGLQRQYLLSAPESDSDTEMVADMLVGFKALREKFTSRVIKQRPGRLEVIYVDGPMRDLDNVWVFVPRADGGCDIEFCVEFTFRNKMFEMLAGQYFDRAFRKLVAAFEARASELYGSSNSSAQSVA
jgi:coenzyme Q-binding protein COQ10